MRSFFANELANEHSFFNTGYIKLFYIADRKGPSVINIHLN